MPANSTMISATTINAATRATMEPIISSARCRDAPSGVVGGPTTLTAVSKVCMGSRNLASILLEQGPSLIAELGFPVLVEGCLGERFPEGCGISLVEGQTLSFQALLQAGVGLGHIIPLLLGGSIEVLGHHLLKVGRNTAPNTSAREQPEPIPGVVGQRAVFLNFIEFRDVDQRQRVL